MLTLKPLSKTCNECKLCAVSIFKCSVCHIKHNPVLAAHLKLLAGGKVCNKGTHHREVLYLL